MRVLLVEDEVSIANFIAEGLEEEGFAVDVAYNGKDGLRLALENLAEYDLILLDWPTHLCIIKNKFTTL